MAMWAALYPGNVILCSEDGPDPAAIAWQNYTTQHECDADLAICRLDPAVEDGYARVPWDDPDFPQTKEEFADGGFIFGVHTAFCLAQALGRAPLAPEKVPALATYVAAAPGIPADDAADVLLDKIEACGCGRRACVCSRREQHLEMRMLRHASARTAARRVATKPVAGKARALADALSARGVRRFARPPIQILGEDGKLFTMTGTALGHTPRRREFEAMAADAGTTVDIATRRWMRMRALRTQQALRCWLAPRYPDLVPELDAVNSDGVDGLVYRWAAMGIIQLLE